ncbi:MAG: DUF1501 domain-containing protein [Pseudomonadota bacterium]
MISRRHLIASGLVTSMSLGIPTIGFGNTGSHKKFVLVLLRGAADGLAIAPPYGDGHYARTRGSLAIPEPGISNGAFKLDGLFGLNPALKQTYRRYQDDQALVLQAIASPYRSRSHFDGQDYLESGSAPAAKFRDGWLNRALSASKRGPTDAIAIAQNTPLILRGQNTANNWAPATTLLPEDATLDRIAALYANDEFFATRLAQARKTQSIASNSDELDGKAARPNSPDYYKQVSAATAKFLTSDGGPNIAVMEFGGWDTHANQGTTSGALFNRLAALDTGLDELYKGLGPAWDDTVITVVTEFGRTVRVNGTRGTDHGTGSAALVLGGAVKGGRVIADWPGLADKHLFEGRDLAPTRDLRGLFKSVLVEHLEFDDAQIDKEVFPASRSVQTIDGLLS